MNEFLKYLVTQKDRMNAEQIELVNRSVELGESELLRVDEKRLATLYWWLHMSAGSVADRKFTKPAPQKKRK